MLKFRTYWVLPSLTILLVLGFRVSAGAQQTAPPLDSTLFTTYGTDTNLDTLSWLVCGSTQGSSGCYGSGGLGPFGKIGAMIEGNPSTHGNVVTRSIYIVDVAAGGGTGVILYVYKKTDTITTSFDTVSVTLRKTVTLPLTGGSSAKCFMAANTGFLFIGTDQTSVAVQVKKSTLAVTQISVTSGINISSITANQYGYVTVTQGGGSSGIGAFGVWGPTGALQEDGGGTQFMLDTVNGVLPSALPQ